jgi:hypothetical protein
MVWYHEGDAAGLFDDLMYLLTPLESSGFARNDGTYNIFHQKDPRTGVRLDDLSNDWTTGFKREFRDKSNQVTHATGSLQAAMWLGRAGLAYMQYRELDSPFGSADARLNQRCYHIATGIKSGGSSWQLADIEAILERELGDLTESGPWNGPDGGDP